MYEHETDVQEDVTTLNQDEVNGIRAEIECWLIDDFVDILPRDRYTHLNIELG